MYARLRQIRSEMNIPVDELAALLGLKTNAAYYKKEMGMIKFSLPEARVISNRMKKPIEDIFFADELSIMES